MPSVAITSRHLELGKKACAFLTASTDPFHAVQTVVSRLEAAGFTQVPNKALKDSNLQVGGKYYYTVHHSTLVAFTIGKQFQAGESGFKIIGGHTDSPNLAVKPNSKKPVKNGTIQLGVQCYGGGLWHTWFDRDLSISGKVLVRDNTDTGGKIQSKLVNIKDPVARVSTLCIHLQSAEERNAFAVNKEDHTSPILAMSPNKELEESIMGQINCDAWREGQEPILLQRIAKQLNIDISQIADFELSLYDTQPATIGGIQQEFLNSARLDNLATVFCATEALAEHDPDQDSDISMMVAFDHEEVGSVSSHGAGSPVLEEAIRRVSSALLSTDAAASSTFQYDDLYANTIAKSFCLSIDQAHAVHPNYASKHEAQHAPVMNGGIVIKTNANQRYTTNGQTGFLLRELGRAVNVPIQEFAVRNDCPCGSTIGPTISANTGMRVVDAGMPQLSMHSCREVMGIADLSHGLDLFKGFYSKFREIDDKLDA